MTTKATKTLVQKRLAFLFPLILAGCYIDSDPPKPWNPAVERSSKHYEVTFQGRVTQLSPQQTLQLKRMIASYSKAPPLHARLVLRHAREDMLSDTLKSRLKTLRQHLISYGISRKNIELQFMNNGLSHKAGKLDTIMVTIDQYQALAPKCSWDEEMHFMVRPEGEKNFGCASASNLAQMVADPHDLLKGRPLASTDGPSNSLAVLNLRTDKVKELKIEEAGDD